MQGTFTDTFFVVLFMIVLSLFIVYFVTREIVDMLHENTDRKQRERPCDLCEQGVAHRVFITTPPGYGSIVECSRGSRSNGKIVLDGGQ